MRLVHETSRLLVELGEIVYRGFNIHGDHRVDASSRFIPVAKLKTGAVVLATIVELGGITAIVKK